MHPSLRLPVMAGLGSLLLLSPSALTRLWVTVLLLLIALGGAFIIVRFTPARPAGPD